jgi:Na+-translocating ferredoxin:NAD+ oxidoreductase subunit G
MRTMLKHGFILGLICIIATGLLAVVNLLTAPRIARQAAEELQGSLKDVLPEAVRFETAGDQEYFRAFNRDDRLLGVAFVCAKKGYASEIQTLVGMRPDGTITAIKILSQNETPGLGTRVTEVKDSTTVIDVLCGKRQQCLLYPWFCEQFRGRNIADLNSVQAITGATISSRAVINAIKEKAAAIKEKIDHGG